MQKILATLCQTHCTLSTISVTHLWWSALLVSGTILLAAHYLVRYLHDLTFVFLMFMNLAIDTDFGGPADASKTKEKKN